MRVIAGSARHLQLKTPEGNGTRPTTDRIKETLFNMINYDIPGASFLDLFSGSGGIGIEALSRGASESVFVELEPAVAAIIRENLEFTRLSDNAMVMCIDAITAIRRLNGRHKAFDIIFMDPPYGFQHEKRILETLKGTSLISPDTMIIIEANLDTEFDYLTDLGYVMVKQKIYKTNQHVFVKML